MLEQSATGGCLCGAIRFKANGQPERCGFCHCQSCRRHTGAPVAAYVDFKMDKVEWTSGDRKRFESSPGVLRTFCEKCGSTLTWEGRHSENDWIELHVSALDNPEAFPPTNHTHIDEKLSWLHLSVN